MPAIRGRLCVTTNGGSPRGLIRQMARERARSLSDRELENALAFHRVIVGAYRDTLQARREGTRINALTPQRP